MAVEHVTVYLEFICKSNSGLSVLMTDGENKIWIPYFAIRKMSKVGKNQDYELLITKKIAIEKGIV